MLTCLSHPAAGDALLMGHSIRTKQDAIKRVTNLSPQETAVAANLTVRENLALMAELYGHCKADGTRKAAEMIEQLSLDEVTDRRAGGAAGSLATTAIGLIFDPHILFLDEPTLGFDVLARRELWQVLGGCEAKPPWC